MIPQDQWFAYRTSVISFLETVLGPDSPYCSRYVHHTKFFTTNSVSTSLEILKRLSVDAQGGWLTANIKSLVSAEIFTDFLEMAEHLLSLGYKDPAAVIVGSVLEEHLRNLSEKNDIGKSTPDNNGKTQPKKASNLNDELTKRGVYSSIDNKLVLSCLELRNKAAHGEYDKYDHAQVDNMRNNVVSFIARHPL